MISTKLNKKRRLQAFRKLFVASEKNYSWVKWNQCLFGQMANAIGLQFPKNAGAWDSPANVEIAKKAGQFFGIPNFICLMFDNQISNNWGKVLGRKIEGRDYKTALSVLDGLIAGRRG